jgi:hypothetical protein
MNGLPMPSDIPYAWVRQELSLAKTLARGNKGKAVGRVQEWLCFHGYNLDIDRDYGPVTEDAVRQFQDDHNLPRSGKVTQGVFRELTTPLLRAMSPVDTGGDGLDELAVAYAEQHLAQHPVEIGGDNLGPWVRVYMKGKDGPDMLWCAGFVCFILEQAARQSGLSNPVKTTFSCDSLAKNAQMAGRFVSERTLRRGAAEDDALTPGSLFLCRRTADDWTHVGMVRRVTDRLFETIEGNTNDEGSRNGYEVCSRRRGFKKKDFIAIR